MGKTLHAGAVAGRRWLVLAAATWMGSAGLTAWAEFEPWQDYEFGEGISNVTTVKIHANQFAAYMEGLRDTWVKANEVALELGQIESYGIYYSELPQSGEFNLMLVVRSASLADLEPSQEKYQAFMEKWGEDNTDSNREISADYPDLRTITGEYLMREIVLK